MEFKLDPNDFKEVFSAAVMQALDAEKKEQMIKGALNYLITKPNNSYGSNKSPLQDAFEDALRVETIEFAREYIKNNIDMKVQIEGLISDAVKKIMTDSRDKTVGKIADKIIEGLYSEKY